jgi:hypothetical protein
VGQHSVHYRYALPEPGVPQPGVEWEEDQEGTGEEANACPAEASKDQERGRQ